MRLKVFKNLHSVVCIQNAFIDNPSITISYE